MGTAGGRAISINIIRKFTIHYKKYDKYIKSQYALYRIVPFLPRSNLSVSSRASHRYLSRIAALIQIN